MVYYVKIQKKVNQLNNKNEDVGQYSRAKFKWQIGDIDKVIHTQRYSPLYASEEAIEKGHFAGITIRANKESLDDEISFL